MDAITAVQKSINVYINPDETIDAQQTAFGSIADYVAQQSMQDLIELLEEKLISDDDRERNRATTLLAELFHHRKLPLGASVIHLYVVFFSHRLSDYPSVIPSVQALIGLVQIYENEFDPKYMDALDIFQSVFRSVPVSSCAQTVRFKVLLLFKALLGNANFIPTLEAHGAAILDGLVSCTEEEKDPRCLQEVFTLMHVAIKLFWKSLGARVALPQPEQENNEEEEGAMDVQAKPIDEAYTTMLLSARLFDALSCYFPITFTPPPNDPFGITPEGLTSALEDCLCSYLGPSNTLPAEASAPNSDAAPNSVAAKRKLEPHSPPNAVALDGNAIVRLSVPFFIEQLTTDMHIAKIHALRALTRIVRTNPLHHKVFGLQSTVIDGTQAGGKEGNSKVSAEEAQLYAMVEDGDADYSDMYIQDQLSMDAAAVPLTPQQRLTQSLQQLQMDLYNLTTDQDTMPEHLAELQVHTLTLIGELCKAFDAELSTGNRTSWDSFAAPLDKIVAELSADISSAKAKSAVDIAYVMTRMGGNACCAEVLRKLAPFLLQYAVETHSSVTQAVQRSAQETLRGVDRVLNLAAANKATARGGTINSEDGKLAVGLEMLAQLIACVGNGSNEIASGPTGSHDHSHAHAHSHGHGGGCGHDHGKEGHSCGTKHTTSSAGSGASGASSHDHSHGHSHSAHSTSDDVAVSNSLALRPYAAPLFDALYSYTRPTQVDIPASTSGVAVNPFAAVRSAFAEDSNTEPVSSDLVSANDSSGAENVRVPVLVVPAPAVLAIVGSISAMKELFSRCALERLPADKISAYVRNVTQLAVQGLPPLFRTDPTVLTVEHAAGADAQSPAEVLHRSCVSFLVSLCRISSAKSAANSVSVADEILSSHCVAPLLSLLAECNGPATVSFAERRAYEVLGALGRECTMRSAARNTGGGVGSLLDLIVPHLLSTIQDTVTNIAEYPAGGDRLALALHTLVDVLSPVPAPVTDKDSAVCSNQLKAEYLLRTACYEVPFTQQLLQLLIGNIDALVSVTSTALPVLEHTYTLLRRLVLALPPSCQSTYALDLLQVLLAEVNTATSNGRSFITGVMCNFFVYLDKGSALWAEAGKALVESCCEFGWFQLTSVPDTSAVFQTPSVVDFGAAQLIAIIVNKVHSEDSCERIVQKALQVFAHGIHRAETTEYSVPVALLLWVTKAVSMRPNLKLKLTVEQLNVGVGVEGVGTASTSISADLVQAVPSGAPLPSTWQEYLIALLRRILTYQSAVDNESARTLQLALASQMSVLTTDHELILSTSLRATATNAALFWKQKLWNRLFAKLQTAEVSRSESAFTAVLRMLSVCALSTGVPVNIMQDSLTQLVSVVVTAMSYRPKSDCPERECVTYISSCAVLSQQSMCTLEVLLKHDAQLFIPYLNIVMPALVETSLSAASAKLRATALEGLLSITEHVPYARLFPFKVLVSKGLVKALDDRKKAVRVLAGRVRNKWIVMK